PYSGCRGDRFDRGATFGHSGFTGTSFWIDPVHQCYVILLSNSVHPNGKGNVLRLRHDVATVAAETLLGVDESKVQPVLAGIDVLVYDIQDVGARYYTYTTTLGHCMESAAAHHLPLFVLDRPNPVTGRIVDGPLADEDQLSFIAFAPIPVSHGMTHGELARL